MKKLNNKGFALTEVIIAIVLLALISGAGAFTYFRINSTGSTEELTKDKVIAENLEKARQELSDFVTENNTIPTAIDNISEVSYNRLDNQSAELCATFLSAKAGTNTSFSFWDIITGKASRIDNTHKVYRDDVDFGKHAKGRNCYQINYAPINEAYRETYRDQKKNHMVCDSFRQYDGKFTGQTIEGFFIGGTFTATPASSDDQRLVLAQDADAFDSSCKKIPISELKVGDKVELFIEDGPVNGPERTYFVKAIKKEF